MPIHKAMKALFFLVIGTLLATSAEAKLRLCYFSFTNQREIAYTKKLADEVSSGLVEVKEYLPERTSPETAFLNMVKTGDRCDGLVITGHHTGSWGGARASGKLSLDFVEKLACDPKTRDWFRNLNGVWLEGCRTTAAGEITPQNQDTDRFSADFHTKRVNNDRHHDALTQSVTNLNYEFTTTLDQDNPLSSRYLRIFPKARVFGWSDSAPGEKAESEKSILFHFAHIAKYLDPEDGMPGDPTSDYLSPKDMDRYLKAIEFALQPYRPQAISCKDVIVQAWIDHGTYSAKNPLYAFDNAGLKAFTPITGSRDATQLEVLAQQCTILNAARAGDADALLNAVAVVDSDETYHPYSANLILSVYEQLKKDNPDLAKKLRGRLRIDAYNQDPTLRGSSLGAYLDRRLESNQVGLMRKIDYLRLRQELLDVPMGDYPAQFAEKVKSELLPPLPRDCSDQQRRPNAALFRASFFESVVKNHLVDESYFQALLGEAVEWDILRDLLKNIRNLGLSGEEQKKLVYQVLKHPDADTFVVAAARAELARIQKETGVNWDENKVKGWESHAQPEFDFKAYCASQPQPVSPSQGEDPIQGLY